MGEGPKGPFLCAGDGHLYSPHPGRYTPEITDSYHRIALAVQNQIGAGTNWCTISTWASKAVVDASNAKVVDINGPRSRSLV